MPNDFDSAQWWAQQMRRDVHFAERTLISAGGLVPTFLFHCPSGGYAMPAPWADDEQKQNYMDAATLMCVAHRARGVSMFMETWMSNHRARADGTYPDNIVPPSEDPNRMEAVIFGAQWRAKKKFFFRYQCHPIERNAAGQPIALGLDMFAGELKDREPQGRLFSILPPIEPTDAQVAAARTALYEAAQLGLVQTLKLPH